MLGIAPTSATFKSHVLLISFLQTTGLNSSLRRTRPTLKMSWDTTGGGGDNQWDGGAATTTFNDNATTNDYGGSFANEGGDAGEASGDFGGGNRGACFNCGEEGLVTHFQISKPII